MRILLAEDEEQLRTALARGLREHAYAVDLAADGDAALQNALIADYDAIVLDVQMPKRDGFEVCRELRRRGRTAVVLMLTARDAVEDRIAGLDCGADDYLTKPFVFAELLARLRALLRRSGHVRAAIITVGDLRINTGEQTVQRGSRAIALTAKEYAFLEYLARKAGSVVSRSEISDHVWDENHDPAANLVDVYVSRLRRKIDAGEAVALLHTRRGAGILLGENSARVQADV
jgi:DNA-binding response OmpR family regulator